MTDLVSSAREIFCTALGAVDPSGAVQDELKRLRTFFRVADFTRLLVIGFGKAASPMAVASEEVLGDSITSGIVVTKYGHSSLPERLKRIALWEGAHPVPDGNSVTATRRILDLVREADERTLILCLISGGGSALLVAPAESITLRQKQEVTDLLLKSGAAIHELNAVRKHLSLVKGGRLAEIAHPASITSLIISDVIGDSLDVIASGPTAPDTSTYSDALAVLEKYKLMKQAPQAVLSTFERGARGEIAETPKEGNDIFDNVQNVIIASNSMALRAAKEKAEEMGFRTSILTSELQGEAREAGWWLAERARSLDLKRPSCLLSGGETTVTVKGTGLGGRNTELALAFAQEIDGLDGIILLSAGTDGTDGPTDAAGAIVDGHTVSRAKRLNIDPAEHMENNDSYTLLQKTNDLLITGPTGTNVMDIQIILVA